MDLSCAIINEKDDDPIYTRIMGDSVVDFALNNQNLEKDLFEKQLNSFIEEQFWDLLD